MITCACVCASLSLSLSTCVRVCVCGFINVLFIYIFHACYYTETHTYTHYIHIHTNTYIYRWSCTPLEFLFWILLLFYVVVVIIIVINDDLVVVAVVVVVQFRVIEKRVAWRIAASSNCCKTRSHWTDEGLLFQVLAGPSSPLTHTSNTPHPTPLYCCQQPSQVILGCKKPPNSMNYKWKRSRSWKIKQKEESKEVDKRRK